MAVFRLFARLLCLKVKNGHVRFRTNKNTALNSAKKFNDGVWHYVEAFFDGQTSSICVDNIYCASETSEQPAGYEHGQGLGVDLSSRMVFIADRMEKRQEISQFRSEYLISIPSFYPFLRVMNMVK